jgi:CDP-diacylglycerol--serine O-phosphatidyltransferase
MMVVMISTIYMDSYVVESTFQSHVHGELLTWINATFYGVPNDMDASIKYLPFAALFIPFMSMFRLAKFNIDTRQSDSFIGVPTPMNTLFFMFFPLVLASNFDAWRETDGFYLIIFNPYFLVFLMVLMSSLLVAELPLFALKFKHFHWKGNEIRFSFLITCVALIAIFLVWSIPLIVFLYLILSLLDNRLIKKRTP